LASLWHRGAFILCGRLLQKQFIFQEISEKSERVKSLALFFSLRRPRSLGAEFYYTTTPHNLSSEKCEKICTNFTPEICAFCLLHFAVSCVIV
jgi:hypothetical protein